MGSYYRHTRSERIEVPYSFQCEHCGKDSGRLKAVIMAEATENSNFKNLKPAQEEKLCKRAHENLVDKVKKAHKNAGEKVFSGEFKDQCPCCQEPQSWAVAGLKKKMFENPIACLGAGAVFSIIAVLVYYLGDVDYVTLSMAAGIFGVGVIAAAGCLIWNVIKVNNKTKKTSTGMHNLPVIEWSAVQSLLDEQ